MRIILTFFWFSLGSIACAQTATERHNLEAAFRGLDDTSRQQAQAELQQENLYLQKIDGLWGAGTEQALLAALFMLNEIGTGLSIETEADAQHFLDFLIAGAAQGLIFGEANECADCDDFTSWVLNPLPFEARFSDWQSATHATKLSTAGNYYSALIHSDAQLTAMLQSGQLRQIAEQLVPCMDQMINFGLQTGQKRGSSSLYPDISHSCAFMLQ